MNNKEVKAYQTIQESLHTFDVEINKALRDGWILYSEPWMHNGLLIQQMVKYELTKHEALSYVS